MANVVIRSAQAATGATNRQDLRGAATTASPSSTDPIALGTVAYNETGAAPLSTRAAGAVVVTTADENAPGKAALPTLASRRWMLLENHSDDFDVWWCFGSAVVVGNAFRLGPRGRATFNGDLPNGPLMVICGAGESAVVVAQQC